MAGSYNSQANPGLFVPTTNIWDTAQIIEMDVSSADFKQLLVRLYQNINTIALALNLKDSGYYALEEFLNGQLFFPDPALLGSGQETPLYRQVFRTVVDFGTLPNAGVKSVAHNIDIVDGYSFTRIYATATDPVAQSYIPIPYVSTVAVNNNIELYVDATNVNIATAIDYTAYTKCYVIVEYIKQ